MNAHYTHHEIETLRSAIGKLPAVRRARTRGIVAAATLA
jgi:hypothetical protein